MSEKKNNKSLLGFIKKNLYYLVIGVSLAIIATVIAVVLVTNKKPNVAGKPESVTPYESEQASTTGGGKESEKTPDKPNESESGSAKDPEKESDTSASTKIVFDLPVASSTIIKSYTSSTVVFNKTLGIYTGHMGIDFAADAGTNVVAVYDGTIESVTTSYLQGTTVTIDHGNGLKSVYNSIEAAENLTEGKAVKKGDVIGAVSDNNRQEYKDGAHLHFEIIENGEKIDPETYLLSSEK